MFNYSSSSAHSRDMVSVQQVPQWFNQFTDNTKLAAQPIEYLKGQSVLNWLIDVTNAIYSQHN